MSKNTSEQEDDNHIELFLEAMSQLNNVFEGIKQQDSLPMTREERDRLNGERLNYCDYNYILMGAFVVWECINVMLLFPKRFGTRGKLYMTV